MAGGLDTAIATVKGSLEGALLCCIVFGGVALLYPREPHRGWTPGAARFSRVLDGLIFGTCGLAVGTIGGATFVNLSPGFMTALCSRRSPFVYAGIAVATYKISEAATRPILGGFAGKFSLGVSAASVAVVSRF